VISSNSNVMAISVLVIAALTCVFSASVYASTNNNSSSKPAGLKHKNKSIAIIGNSELPKVDVVLPWRVPSDGDPTKISLEHAKMPDVLQPITVDKHKARVYFHRHGKISVDRFNN